ncbi:DDE domain-containing protein [Halorubrum vacuolatum]|uniref:DDE domain-containing protein n=1 Tax=Halorubrum vacuolatum TaxID=63740 RepID=A0A238XH02_HALVU|nr:DDE domain-containing protein [Halorubrum vacuolatum]
MARLSDALARLGLSDQLDYVERNLIEKWFHTLKMRVDRFHNSWVDSRASVREWLEQFVHYCNTQRPHQSFNGQTPAEVLNYLTSHVRRTCLRSGALARRYYGFGY